MIVTRRNPRILVVTPEFTYLPGNMKNITNSLKTKVGGMADVSATLVIALFDRGAMFNHHLPPVYQKEHD
jgi:starch synthase